MKKILLVLFVLLVALSTMGASLIGSGITSGGSTSCTSLVAKIDANDYWTLGDPAAQKISNSGSVTICEVTVELSLNGTGSEGVYVSIWSTVDDTGTQYGANSGTQTVTNARSGNDGVDYTFTWSTRDLLHAC